MTVEIPHCPNCGSEAVNRNGQTRHHKQNYKCRECRRQFVLNPTWKAITKEQEELMSRMLLERISQAGIARVLQVSEDTVQRYVNAASVAVKKQVEVSAKPKKRLSVQMDELWSFVDNKGNQQWVWLALDAQTREIVGVHIGDRSAVSALALWNSMPPVYRQCAVIYTDHWSAYDSVLPFSFCDLFAKTAANAIDKHINFRQLHLTDKQGKNSLTLQNLHTQLH
jgi:IS1 family transposase/transposase-like protein